MFTIALLSETDFFLYLDTQFSRGAHYLERESSVRTCTFILSLRRPDGASSGNHSATGTASGCMNLNRNEKVDTPPKLRFGIIQPRFRCRHSALPPPWCVVVQGKAESVAA